MKKTLLLLVFLSCLSCKESLVSKIDEDFKDHQWMANEERTFEFKIKHDMKDAEVLLNFSHIHEPGYNNVPLLVTMHNLNDPAPPKDMAVNFMLTEEDGTTISDCSGDICDFSHVLQANGPMKKGNYKLKVQNLYQGQYLPNVLALGVTVRNNE